MSLADTTHYICVTHGFGDAHKAATGSRWIGQCSCGFDRQQELDVCVPCPPCASVNRTPRVLFCPTFYCRHPCAVRTMQSSAEAQMDGKMSQTTPSSQRASQPALLGNPGVSAAAVATGVKKRRQVNIGAGQCSTVLNLRWSTLLEAALFFVFLFGFLPFRLPLLGCKSRSRSGSFALSP